jgi:prephenate dehydrogenase
MAVSLLVPISIVRQIAGLSQEASLHPMFGPKGNPTAANLFNIIACLQEHEGVRVQVVT